MAKSGKRKEKKLKTGKTGRFKVRLTPGERLFLFGCAILGFLLMLVIIFFVL